MSTPAARYGFLPHLRAGLGTRIQNTALEAGRFRASTELVVEVTGTGAGQTHSPPPRAVEFRGPGDVVGIDPRTIIRSDPRPGATDFESNLFPLVEFGPPDMPWRYTPVGPAAAEGPGGARLRLKPWLCPIALEDAEFPDGIQQGKPLPRIKVRPPGGILREVLPDLAESWAWAHVQLSDTVAGESPLDLSEPQALAALLAERPQLAVSRILCVRRLKPRTRYTVFLVPTFETGRRAGLGLPLREETGDQEITGDVPAWDVGDPEVELCFYHRFEFTTGEQGDFESLARLLRPVTLGAEIGYREVDFTEPGPPGLIPTINPPQRDGGEPSLPPAGEGRPTLRLGGALQSRASEPDTWPFPPDRPDPFQTRLRQLLNAGAIDDDGDDPFLVPPIYGRWHAAESHIGPGTAHWLRDLNQDPRHRIAAGFGVEVVQARQEEYMAEAWRQIGDLQLANDAIRAGQVGMAITGRLAARHLQTLSAETLVAITRPLHAKVLGSSTTVYQELRGSPIPLGVLSSTWRKATRPWGGITRRATPPGHGRVPLTGTLLARLNTGEVKVPERSPLDGVSPAVRWSGRGRGAAKEAVRAIDAAAVAAATVPEGLELRGYVPSWSGAPIERRPHRISEALRRTQVRAFQGAAAQALREAEPPPGWEGPPPSLDFSELRERILSGIDPVATIPNAVLARLRLRADFLPAQDRFETIMDHPVFPWPMYEPLRDRSQENILPGVDRVPSNSVGLLLTNRDFVEAYLVGLNHEMARELLWREYPTDQRGSYFRQFWDLTARGPLPPLRSEAREPYWDIRRIHEWAPSSGLGAHSPDRESAGRDNLVLLIRGNLLQKYPNTLIYAVEAASVVVGGHDYFKRKEGAQPRLPIFSGRLPPDITFLGFDLTDQEVRQGAGWFFVLEEPFTEARFGMDVASSPFPAAAPDFWNGLEWGHFPETLSHVPMGPGEHVVSGLSLPKSTERPEPLLAWGRDAATMAAITLQLPMRVLLHSSRMIPEEEPGGQQ